MLFSPSKLSQPFRQTSVRNLALAAAVAAALAFAPEKPALAEDMSACDQFTWPVRREQALFGSKDLQRVASGATLASFPDRGIALELQPHDRRLTRCHRGGSRKSRAAPAASLWFRMSRNRANTRLPRRPKAGSTLFRMASRSPPRPIAAGATARMSERASGLICNRGPLPSRSAASIPSSSSSPFCLPSKITPVRATASFPRIC